MEYIILETKDRTPEKEKIYNVCYKPKKHTAPSAVWQIIAVFYWKEVADAYFEFCNKYGHLNIKEMS